MEDDDVDSNLFFDRVYCANPQVDRLDSPWVTRTCPGLLRAGVLTSVIVYALSSRTIRVLS